MTDTSEEGNITKVHSLVLDATPLITQSASAIQQFAETFYTTPGVHSELRDEHARNQLILWADRLQIRQPKPEYIQKVSQFARLTGDYAVLSLNDIHIIALAYEIECEVGNQTKLREYPGEKKEGDEEKKEFHYRPRKEYIPEPEEEEQDPVDDDGFTTVAKKYKAPKKGKYPYKKKEEPKVEEVAKVEEPIVQQPVEEAPVEKSATTTESTTESTEEVGNLPEEYDEEDDDGDWITPQNLKEEMLKDSNEKVVDAYPGAPRIEVALSTGDFACHNVAMQIGLSLMNSLSGKQIRRVRNYMFRCHACFRLTPIPKNGQPKHFCPKCGGNTLLRCAVSIDSDTGKIVPHLKANFRWIKRGDIFSMPSPLSKNYQKQVGKGGYQHNKENRHKLLQNPLILREDQKEYQQAIKDDDWQRRTNEKMLEHWIGGGSADNYVSPFVTMNTKASGVRVGRGRHANASKGKRK